MADVELIQEKKEETDDYVPAGSGESNMMKKESDVSEESSLDDGSSKGDVSGKAMAIKVVVLLLGAGVLVATWAGVSFVATRNALLNNQTELPSWIMSIPLWSGILVFVIIIFFGWWVVRR